MKIIDKITTSKKIKRGFLVVGVTFGLSAWGVFFYGASKHTEDIAPKNVKWSEVEHGEETPESADNSVNPKAKDNNSSASLDKPDEDLLVERVKSLKELDGEDKLDSEVADLLTKLSFNKDVVLKMLKNASFMPLNGTYVYPATVVAVGDNIEISLGLSKESVAKSRVSTYRNLTGNKGKVEEGSNYLSLVKYSKGRVLDVELYYTKNTVDNIQHAILKSNIKKEEFKTKLAQKKLEDNSFENLTIDEWKGMTLLASRDILAKDMGPIVVVPTASLSQSNGDFEGTFYYIVGGQLEKTSPEKTVLRTYEGKTINLDFGVDNAKKYIGSPVWVHLVTQEGSIQNVEIQGFSGANVRTMSAGMISFIGTASAELYKEEKESKKKEDKSNGEK